MVKISPQQLLYIKKQLSAYRLHHDLQEELLDHLATLTEEQMASGQSFTEACNNALSRFEKDDIQAINQSIISLHKKNLFMKLVVFSCSALAITLATFFIWASPNLAPSRHMTTLIPADGDVPALEVPDMESFFTEANPFEPPSISPIKNARQTSGFGMRMHPIHKVKKLHRGMDFAAAIGTPVVATADGKVTKVKLQTEGYGKHLVIQHDDIYSTLYAQLSKILVKEGQYVQKGDTIGLVGSSGASTAPHLHYEVRKQGEYVDPEPFLHP